MTARDYAPQASIDPKKHAHWEDGSMIIRAKEIPWSPWALPGTEFKLLDYDRNTSFTVILLKILPEAPETIHKHIGAGNAYIVQGGFGYDHGEVFEGDYMSEAGGVSHTPHVHPEGCTLLGFMNGAVAGLNEDGSLAGLVDVDWMIAKAKENNAFSHLEGGARRP